MICLLLLLTINQRIFVLKILRCYVLLQRDSVLTGIAVFGERDTLSSTYTLLDRTFDTCMLILFCFFCSQVLIINFYIYAVITNF